MAELKVRQRVRLVPTGNCPEEYGIILGIESSVVLVEIDEQYRDNTWDDGFREVPFEQIEIER